MGGDELSRRRYISTKISLDKVVNQVARDHGDFAALFYTWGISHAEEDASIYGDTEEILAAVMPMRRDKTASDIEATIRVLADAGLVLWDKPNGILQYPIASFYEYQSNIHADKRRTADIANDYRESAENSGEQRRTARKRASSSLSSSSSLSITDTVMSNVCDATTDAFHLSVILRDEIVRNNMRARVPNPTPEGMAKWSSEMDRIVRIDKRPVEEVEKLIRWCQHNSFWYKNILSVDKLRKQYDRLWLEMTGENSSSKPSFVSRAPRVINEFDRE